MAARAAGRFKRTMLLLKENEGKSENEKINSIAAVDIVAMAHSHMMYVAF